MASGNVNSSYLALWKHFVGTVAKSSHGKLLLGIWGSYFVWLVTLKKKKKMVDPDRKKPSVDKDLVKRQVKGLKGLIEILKPYAFKRQGGIFALYVATLCSRIFVTVYLADMSGRLAGMMGARKWDQMFRGQAWFGLFCSVAAGTTAAMKFLEKQCALSVREILFKHLSDRYLDKDNLRFYHQDLADASARLTADLEDFSEELVHLVGHFLKPLIDIMHLSFVMKRRIGLQSLAIFYGFFWFADYSLKRVRTRAVWKNLKQSSLDKNRLQSELRTSLAQIHHYREQIAMQKGVSHEHETVIENFAKVRNEALLENIQMGFIDFFNSSTLKYGGLMVAFSILTPSAYLDPSKSGEEITTTFFSNSSLLGSLASAVKDMADSFSRLPKVRGLAERVFELEDRMQRVDEYKELHSGDRKVAVDETSAAIILNGIDIAPPPKLPTAESVEIEQPATLVEDVTFAIEPNQHTVIRGRNGMGKSSVFRIMTGLWPISKGGSVTIPASLFVLPQDSYFTKSTLRDQIVYPLSGDNCISDEKASELLSVVGLGELLERFSLDDIADWTNSLSGGQRQRLGWARLYFHAPKFCLLDEATSAISKEGIEPLFSYAKNLGMTLLTISHSNVVDQQHSRAIDFVSGGSIHIQDI